MREIKKIIIRFGVLRKQTNHANHTLSKHWKTPTGKKKNNVLCENCVLYVNLEFARNQSNSVAFYDCGGQELLMPNFRFFLTFWVTTLNQSDLQRYTKSLHCDWLLELPSPPLTLLWLTRSWALSRKALFFMSCMKFYKSVLRKYARWLVKNRVSKTRWKHRISMSCWRNDGASKENLPFDDQCKEVLSFFSSRCFLEEVENMFSVVYRVIETLVKVWENSKKPLWKHSPTVVFPQHSPFSQTSIRVSI